MPLAILSLINLFNSSVKKFFFINVIFAVLISFKANSQINRNQLDTFYLFKDLKQALIKPDEVYRLQLKNKKLDSLPLEIFFFKNLIELDLSKNKLKYLPKQLETLSNLEVLVLTANKIEKFPNEIWNLSKLKVLRLARNDLFEIPDEIEKLQDLQILDLWDNNLSAFSDKISKLKNLKVLDLRGILLDEKQQNSIKELLPETKIYFSPSCNCGF